MCRRVGSRSYLLIRGVTGDASTRNHEKRWIKPLVGTIDSIGDFME